MESEELGGKDDASYCCAVIAVSVPLLCCLRPPGPSCAVSAHLPPITHPLSSSPSAPLATSTGG